MTQNWADLDKRHIWHPFTQAKIAAKPIFASSGQGAYITTESGDKLLDLISSWWVNLHGHGHPVIADAIARQALQLEQALFADFTHRPAIEFSHKLSALLPNTLSRFFYSDNGSTAIEVALKMALQYFHNLGEHKRKRLIAFDGGYHGDTVGAMSLGQSSCYFQAWKNLLFPVDILPFPETWQKDDRIEEKEAQCLKLLDEHLKDDVAAVIIEPLIQGAGGMRLCRPKFLQTLGDKVKDSGALLIFDEVMTGFGRTGELFACLTAKLTDRQSPDFLCLSKGITGGFLPMAVTITHDKIYEAFYSHSTDQAFLHGHSYTANPLGCAAAIASLDLLMSDESLLQRNKIAALHQERVSEVSVSYHPRSLGTIAAVTLPEGRYGDQLSHESKAFFLKNKMILRPIGPVLYFLPPYCIDSQDLNRAWDLLLTYITQKNPPSSKTSPRSPPAIP
jgi:adenosylmethionine-8-amino-7-oxononanoate aminotransferase